MEGHQCEKFKTRLNRAEPLFEIQGGVGEGGVLAHLRRLRQHQGEGALGTDRQMDLVAANWDGGANGRERTCGGGLVKVAAG